jgi:hypothetical protein
LIKLCKIHEAEAAKLRLSGPIKQRKHPNRSKSLRGSRPSDPTCTRSWLSCPDSESRRCHLAVPAGARSQKKGHFLEPCCPCDPTRLCSRRSGSAQLLTAHLKRGAPRFGSLSWSPPENRNGTYPRNGKSQELSYAATLSTLKNSYRS